MKRLIFCLALFSLTFMSAIASDVGKQANDMLQNSCVVQKISTPIINAVNFETAQVVINSTSMIIPVKVSLSPVSPPSPTYYLIDPGRYLINKALLSNIYNPITLNDQTLIQISFRPNSLKLSNSFLDRTTLSPPVKNSNNQTPDFKYSSTVRHVFHS